MEASSMEEITKALGSCIPRAAWRLRPSARRRLEIDILCLCTRMRPVVMVDYGGKMPELKDRLISLLGLAQQESTAFLALRLMVIEDMVYIVNIDEFAEYTSLFISSKQKLLFVDLEEDPPKMLLHEQNAVASELELMQKLFLPVLQAEVSRMSPSILKGDSSDDNCINLSSVDGHHRTGFRPLELVDLRNFVKDAQITLPTINGWLLGYPVAYLFGKDRISDAVYNLSTKSLHIYKVLACRNTSDREQCDEELLSFTVPYDLSMRGEEEPWAKEFAAWMSEKLEGCRHVWARLRLDVSHCYPQAIAL